MESTKRKLIRSLRFRLCLALTIVGIIYTGFSCYRSYNRSMLEASVFIDEELAQIANVIINYDVILPKSWEGPSFRRRVFTDYNGNIIFPYHHMQRSIFPRASINDLFDKHQEIMIAPIFAKPGETFYFPANISDGMYTVLIQDKRVRSFVATNRQGIRFVVARPLELLDELIYQALIHSVGEFLLLIIIYVPCIIFFVNLFFRPVNRAASKLNARRENDLSPISQNRLPSEIDGFVDSINHLFHKNEVAINNERRFIADAAHELRTPLTAISLQAQSVNEELLPESEALKFKRLKQAISRQRTLTNNLLEYARCQCGHVLHYQNIYVKDIFIEVIDDFGSIADSRNIDLGLEGNCDIMLYTDRANLKTVISNLVSNALKYTPEGGQCDLYCSKDDKNNTVEICIDDTGPGISEEELKLVFNAFYRVGGDSSRVEGTGLGLSIVKSALEEISGTIELSNRSTGGLHIRINLPLRPLKY